MAVHAKIRAERKADRTRERIIAVFNRLVFADGFEKVTVRRILQGAEVARSTFYEYFGSKDEVLRASMSHFLAVMAECTITDGLPPRLTPVLEHMWDNRRLTDAIFTGSARVILGLTLTEMIEAHLREADREAAGFSYRLAAIQLAEGQLALVETWLRGRAFSQAAELARILHSSSRAGARALLQ